MIKLIKFTFSSNSWKLAQFSLILNESLLGFLTGFLIIYGFAEQYILLALSFLYFFVATFFLLFKNIILNKEKIIFNIILISVFVFSISSYFFIDLKIFTIILSSFLVLLFKDLSGVNSFSEINSIAEKNNINTVQLLSFSVIISMLISAFMFPFLGFVFDYNSDLVFLLSTFLIFIILYFINFRLKFKFQQKTLKNKLKTPKIVLFQCFLSTLYNSSSFLITRFTIPLFIIEIGQKYNFNGGFFKYIGAFLGFIALLNLVSRFSNPKIKIDPIKMMFLNYFISIFCFILIGILFYMVRIEENMKILNYYLLLIALLFCIYNFSSKFWSIGFLENLKNLSKEHSTSENSELLYKSYLNIFMSYKNYGAFLGFFFSFVFYSFMNVEIILIILGVISILYGFYSMKLLKQ